MSSENPHNSPQVKLQSKLKTIWPEDDSPLGVKQVAKASFIFHLILTLLFVGLLMWDEEPEVIEVPPIMELVSAPPPPKTPKVQPTKKPEPEPEIKPEPEPEIKPEPEPEPEPKQEPEQKPKELDQPQEVEKPTEEPQEEWDSDFEVEDQEPKIQKVVAPKVDNRLRMFENTVRMKIMKNFNPPKGLGVPYGTEFLIEITCVRQGGPAIDVKVHTRSGSSSLDNYGLRAIKLAILPKIPMNYPEDRVKLHVKFVYNE